jgi:hypothetical protein
MAVRSEDRFVVRALRALGQVEFTMVLLIGGALVMIAGTLVESRGGRELAWASVYGTAWFDVFLFLIGVNLAMAVVNRIPIQPHQWSFVLTHFAILLLLVGAFISRTYGYEGRLVISEGDEQSRIFLDSSEIWTAWSAPAAPDSRGERSVDAVGEAAFPLPRWVGEGGLELQPVAPGRPGLRLAEYLQDGVGQVALGEGSPEDAPAIEFSIDGMGAQMREWLIADDPQHGRAMVGPLQVRFRSAAAGQPAPDEGSASLAIWCGEGAEPARIVLPRNVGRDFSCGPDAVVTVHSFLLRARLVAGVLTDASSGDLNPAAVVEVSSAGRSERHTVFSRFPDYGVVHGRDSEQPLVAKIELEAPSAASRPVADIVIGTDGLLYLMFTSSSGEAPPLELWPGTRAPLGQLPLGLKIERYLDHGRAEVHVNPTEEGATGGRPWAKLAAQLEGTTATFWVPMGGTRKETLDGRIVSVAFRAQTRPLPFAVRLSQFELIHHPGSTRAAEYRSRVVVRSLSPGAAPREFAISMNRPLDIEGFRLFQSSYQLGRDGGPDTTILSVSRDPGAPIVYVSFVLIVIGVGWYLLRNSPGRALVRSSLAGSAAAPASRDEAADAPPERA